MRHLSYVISAAWQGFWRNPVMSVASTLTVSLMLMLFAFFVVTDRGLQAAVSLLESKVEIVVYVEDDATVSDVLTLKSRIEADPAVAQVEYVSKEQALERLKEIAQRRADLEGIEDVGTNPLPASLEIKLASAQESQRVAADLTEEKGLGIVAEVIDNPQVVDKLLTITRVLSFGGLAVLGMMLFVALFVIVNTIRIAVHARRDEIEIMKLVGATDWFVRWPFILEGMLVGAFGALVALAVLFAASGPVTSALIGFLDILPVSLGANFMTQLAAFVLGFALLVGAGGASLSVRTHLAK
ncbi:MAG: permease-like cell division protein FtsX [Candidatus Limnocylindria bacterium]